MSQHDKYQSFIKTPQQLLVILLVSFLVPIVGILLLVTLVLNQSGANAAALNPEAVAARLQPVGHVEFGAPAAAPGARSGQEIVQGTCATCHVPGVANAPKIGDQAVWAKLAKEGLPTLLRDAIKGQGAMPPRGGLPDLTDYELARAIVTMANQSGAGLKEPAAPKKK